MTSPPIRLGSSVIRYGDISPLLDLQDMEVIWYSDSVKK